MLLNEIKIKNLKPKTKTYKENDGGGLYLHVSPTGSKRWYATYRFHGRKRQVSLGKYPIVTLKMAREKNLDTKRLIDQGIDPVENKKQKKLDYEMQHENNFEAIAREWHSQKEHTWQPRHAERILTRLSSHIFPKIGTKPITEIKPPELLLAIKPIEDEGKHEMAHRVLQTCGQIFRYAVACGKAERDITQDLKGALKPAKTKSHAHLKEKELPAFLKKLNDYDLSKDEGGCNGNPITKWGFQLTVLTFVRSSELREAKWEEIDWEKNQWRIPPERMKVKDGQPHIVPLTKQTIALFKKIQEVTAGSYSGYIFPSFQNPRKPISDGTFLKVIKLMGYKDRTTGHGFRHTASTILNENGFNKDWIERQLAHGDRDLIRATYNYAQYLPQRAEMMQWYSDHIESLGMKC